MALLLALGLPVATVGCGASLTQTAPAPHERWLALETPHFVVRTDLAEPAAREIADSLEWMRAALLTLAWTGAKDPRGRTQVVVFARPSDFQRYVGLPMAAGIAVSHTGSERTLAFTPGPDGGIPNVAVHELAHDLSQWFMPVQPRWFAEGLAVYLENTRFDPKTRRATLGGVSSDSADWLRETGVLVRSSRLFSMRESLQEDPRETASFYASAWLFVHYLINHEGEAFSRYQAKLAQLVPPHAAWQASFGDLSLDELDQRVIDYAQSTEFTTLSAVIEREPFELEPRVLTQAEVHGTLARLSSLLGQEVSRRETLEALRLDPAEPSALAVRFEALAPDATDERRALARRAVAAHPELADAWILAARAEPPGDERDAAVARARELAPDHPGVALLLAEDAVRGGEPRAALAHTTLALRRSPLTADLLALHVRALGAHGRCTTARALTLSSPSLFSASCRVHSSGGAGPACEDVVRRAWGAVEPACGD